MKIIRMFSGFLLMGVLIMASVTVTYGAGWTQDNKYWGYENEDGSHACNGSQFINGRQCHFDEKGHLTIEGSSQGNEADEALYKAYITNNFIEKDTRIALADLTRNGHDELVIAQFSSGGFNPWIRVCTIEKNQVKEIFQRQCSFRNQIYLTIRDNQAFLINLFDGVYQGEGDLSYSIFCLNADGTENTADEYSIHLILDTVDGNRKYDEFYKKFEEIKKGSTVILDNGQTALWPVSVLSVSNPVAQLDQKNGSGQ